MRRNGVGVTHILFVDRGALARTGLAQSMGRLRPEWQAVFVDSEAAALERLAVERFDAVVCDNDLPDLNGAQLLTRVRDLHPNVVRLCLSTSMDDEGFLNAVPVTHQFLRKPCQADTLCDLVERACTLREILHNEAIQGLIGKIKHLPTTSRTFDALSKAMAKPNAHTHDITQIVSGDTPLCIKILQIVNSGFFRRSAPITSVKAAITFAGLEMIKSLALSACVFNSLDASEAASRLLHDLQSRSIRKANFARALMDEGRHADEAFTAALLLDIGQAILALSAPEKFDRMIAVARSTGRPWHELEPDYFGVAHPEVGAYLLGLWGLPLDLIEVVAYHHQPSLVQHPQTDVLAAVHVADAVIDATPEHTSKLIDRLDAQFVQRTEVSRWLAAWNIDTEADALVAQRVAAA
jgi:HD-like signal output (HDOD) protein